ncbi:MAG TPA: hypothetical protein VNH83_18500, partial [Bryobacteraceae bacterium]|nr:hypothetical protein [Bryobacteraceae bacterium]
IASQPRLPTNQIEWSESHGGIDNTQQMELSHRRDVVLRRNHHNRAVFACGANRQNDDYRHQGRPAPAQAAISGSPQSVKLVAGGTFTMKLSSHIISNRRFRLPPGYATTWIDDDTPLPALYEDIEPKAGIQGPLMMRGGKHETFQDFRGLF